MKTKIIAILIMCGGFIFAKEETFVREYTYIASDYDSKVTSRANALDQCKQILLEEVSVFIMSEFEMEEWENQIGKHTESGMTVKETIQSVSAGITKTEILEETWNGKEYYLKATITIDKDDIRRKLDKILASREKTQELQKMREEHEKVIAELKRLREELTKVKDEKEALKLAKTYTRETEKLTAQEYFNRAYDAAENEDYEQAIADWTKAIEIDPNYTLTYYNRGIAKRRLGDISGAITDYNKVIEINPNDAGAYYNRGNAKYNFGDISGAIADYTKAIDINPNYVSAYYNRGIAKRRLGDISGAIADYNKVIEIDPNDVDAYYNRGIAKYDLGNYSGAIDDYTKVIEINPNYASAYFNRGVAKYLSSDEAGGCKDWHKAGELGHSNALVMIKKYCQ